MVLKLSFPVIILDEILKFISRKFIHGKLPIYDRSCQKIDRSMTVDRPLF